MSFQPTEKIPQTQQIKQNEKIEKHAADEGTWQKPTGPNIKKGNRQVPEKKNSE